MPVPQAAARPALIGIPDDSSSSFMKGAAEAPPIIRAALQSGATNTWSELGVDIFGPDGVLDGGDVDFTGVSDRRAAIDAAIGRLLSDSRVPLAMGGDHAITYPIVRAMHRRRSGFTILHVDAHPDLYDVLGGDRYSHGCPFARILEEGLAAPVVQVGIRGMNGHQRDQAARFGVDVIDMRRWVKGDRPAVHGPVYVSIDLDGIDPAFAPGVSHREPGGLSVRDIISLIHDLEGPIVGADVVEFNPGQDPAGITAWVAAKLVKELAGRCLLAYGSNTADTGSGN